MQTAVSGATAPSSLALSPPMPEHDSLDPLDGLTPLDPLDGLTSDQARILREFEGGRYRVLIEGGTPEARARIAARVADVLPPPGPGHAIRNALQILESGAMPITDPVLGRAVAFDEADLAGVQRLLMTALERDAAREALTESVSLEDSVSVQQLVDEFEETPHRFAVRFMNLAAFARQLTRRVETLEERSPLGFPRPMGAARS